MDELTLRKAADRYLRSNLLSRRPLNVADLAKALNMSVSTLYRTFVATLGETPARYLRRRRVGIAVRLLTGSELDPLDIAERAGFNSPETYYRAVRQVTGSTPEKIRKSGLSPSTTQFAAKIEKK